MTTRYRLKAGFESFDIVDGPDAGRRFARGLTYSEPPSGFEARFEPVEEEKPKSTKRSSKTVPEVADEKL